MRPCDALLVEQFSVRADAQLDDDNVMVTLAGHSWLLNVDASPTDWQQGLVAVPDADPDRRLDVKLGTSGGRPVWWSIKGDELTLSVGRDVESWNFVVVVPSALLSEIQAQVSVIEDEWH